uniref:Interleukin-3 receptor class 2 subunit beta-like n=1 Tax=Echeneis naucrates TaxID=173247 RepID=A0A665WSM0_ECHNA
MSSPFYRYLDNKYTQLDVLPAATSEKNGLRVNSVLRKMSPLWVVLWSVLPLLACLTSPDLCTVYESSMSALLQSLECHNDYQTYVHCRWQQHRNTAVQLWFKTAENRELCVPYSPRVPDDHRTVQCRYNTRAFSIGIEHTVFFVEKETLTACSSVPRRFLDLSQQLRTRTPKGLSTYEAADGSRWLSWSSPYASSSSLNKNLTYQLSYRADTQDHWSTVNVTNTNVKLDEQLQGHRFEAKVRAQALVGQWSDWCPVVTWSTGQIPSLHCVLDEEKEVTCSWEVSRELAHFITYQLACRHNQTAPFERCCVRPTVSSDPSGMVLLYSCSLTLPDPTHLHLELQPTRHAKTFKAYQHIRPDPPQQVKMKEVNNNWILEWTKPGTASKVELYYQVCYYKTQDKVCSKLLNISNGSTYKSFPADSLEPSQRYEAKVRSLVIPGEGHEYNGIPSKWTDPVDWTSHEDTCLQICVNYYVTNTLSLYGPFGTNRRAILWVDSVPSPAKSKILSEIKAATSRTLMQREQSFLCKEGHYDTIKTSSLWPSIDTEKQCLESSELLWIGDNFPISAVKVNSSDTSCMSFSGPYIFCQKSEAMSKSVDVKCEEKEKEEKTVSEDSPSPVNFTLFGESYVCLPNGSVSRSTLDLTSHSDASTNTNRDESPEQNQDRPNTTLGPDKANVQPGFMEAISSDHPPPYVSGPLFAWPQAGTLQTSGYCHLPAP